MASCAESDWCSGATSLNAELMNQSKPVQGLRLSGPLVGRGSTGPGDGFWPAGALRLDKLDESGNWGHDQRYCSDAIQ